MASDRCFVFQAHDFIRQPQFNAGDAAESIIPPVVLAVGLVLLFFGAKLVRPACGLIGSLSFALFVEEVMYVAADLTLSCEIAAVLAVFAAFAGFWVGYSLLECGTYLLGFAGGGFGAVFFFSVVPQLNVDLLAGQGAPNYLGEPLLLYWAVVLVAGASVGQALLSKQAALLVMITALLGALMVVDAGGKVLAASGVELSPAGSPLAAQPMLSKAVAAALCFALGAFAQRQMMPKAAPSIIMQ
jgi:hypothetical protein